MTATASYNNATKVITVESNGLPAPVSFGTFPNDNNPNTVTEQDFDHDFLYRGGTFGIARTFDNNGYTHDGYIKRATISVNDLTLFTGISPDIAVDDHIMVVFSDGLKQKFRDLKLNECELKKIKDKENKWKKLKRKYYFEIMRRMKTADANYSKEEIRIKDLELEGEQKNNLNNLKLSNDQIRSLNLTSDQFVSGYALHHKHIL